MKINSILGKMNGKIGNIVVSSVNGQVIGREYNPNVANPNTVMQQNTRSKFKLASQLSAAMAPVIAIRKEGAKSARNIFVSQNFDQINYNLGVASINLNVVQLTKSQTSFVGFNADRSVGTAINVELNDDAAAQLTRVVYIGYKKLSDGSLQLFDSKVCETAGADGRFADVLRYDAGDVVLYAYGMKDLESGITTKFGNMNAPSAQDAANLLISSTENMQAVQLTKTAGLTMITGEDTGSSDDVEHILVSVTSSGNGSAVGGGRYEAGQLVTVRATPDAEATFEGWHIGTASGTRVSTSPVYSFNAETDITLVAKFEGGPTPHYTIAVSADPVDGGTVTGGGSIEEGASCTVVATPAAGKVFDGWFENGSLVSNNASYTFTVETARTLVAVFADEPEGMIQSVKVNGNDIVANTDLAANANYVGAFDASANGKTFAIVESTTVPTIGQSKYAYDPVSISSGSATIHVTSNQGDGKAYFVVGTLSGQNIAIEEVFGVALNLQGGD